MRSLVNIAFLAVSLHEAIHAHLGYYVMVIKENNSINVSDFPGILDYFSRYGNNNWQHEQMAQHYRDVIIQGNGEIKQTILKRRLQQTNKWKG